MLIATPVIQHVLRLNLNCFSLGRRILGRCPEVSHLKFQRQKANIPVRSQEDPEAISVAEEKLKEEALVKSKSWSIADITSSLYTFSFTKPEADDMISGWPKMYLQGNCETYGQCLLPGHGCQLLLLCCRMPSVMPVLVWESLWKSQRAAQNLGSLRQCHPLSVWIWLYKSLWLVLKPAVKIYSQTEKIFNITNFYIVPDISLHLNHC